MKRLLAAALTGAALLTATAGITPASAANPCNNEPSDVHDGHGLGVGIDLNDPGVAYVCAGNVLVAVYTSGHVIVCSNYTYGDGNPANDRCEIHQ